jgi:hypothetical protein
MLPLCLVLLGKISLFLVDYTYNHDMLKAFGHEISHEYAAGERHAPTMSKLALTVQKKYI